MTTISGYEVEISHNSSLVNVDGLAGAGGTVGHVLCKHNPNFAPLESVGSAISIRDNPQLVAVSGFPNLVSVGGGLYIEANQALSNIDGLNGFTEINYHVQIAGNPSLSEISGLANLAAINDGYVGLALFNNGMLQDVAGFASLISVDGDVSMSGNGRLAECWPFRLLLDNTDHALPGPGPGPDGAPDVGGRHGR